MEEKDAEKQRLIRVRAANEDRITARRNGLFRTRSSSLVDKTSGSAATKSGGKKRQREEDDPSFAVSNRSPSKKSKKTTSSTAKHHLGISRDVADDVPKHAMDRQPSPSRNGATAAKSPRTDAGNVSDITIQQAKSGDRPDTAPPARVVFPQAELNWAREALGHIISRGLLSSDILSTIAQIYTNAGVSLPRGKNGRPRIIFELLPPVPQWKLHSCIDDIYQSIPMDANRLAKSHAWGRDSID